MFMSEIEYIYTTFINIGTNKHIIQMTSTQIINELAKNKVIEKQLVSYDHSVCDKICYEIC